MEMGLFIQYVWNFYTCDFKARIKEEAFPYLIKNGKLELGKRFLTW